MNRTFVQRYYYFRLILASAIIGLISCLLAISLEKITGYFEHHIFQFAQKFSFSDGRSLLFIFLPTIGITAIYFTRKYLFKNRKNKGITEIYKTLDHRKDHLPFFKIPSHYINGFLTVIFGGSTGIEVSTVVYTATVGNVVYKLDYSAKMYKRELICAGVTAGIAILFSSPLAGALFAIEAIARKINRTLVISCTTSGLVAWIILHFFIDSEPIVKIPVTEEWRWVAIPFMLVLSILGALLSIYFTNLVVKLKSFFSGLKNNFIRVNLGALMVGVLIFFSAFLYGDGYHALNETMGSPQSYSIVFLLILALLKPLASSLTLGAGGDGGVFAPSIVAGTFLGIGFALLLNEFLGTSFEYVNFALIGAASTLSASIYAPFCTLFLICNLVPNGFQMFFPLMICCLFAKYFSQWLFPYNVYTYGLGEEKK